MRTIPPRLGNLLSILASEPVPLPVKEVADRLRVSKRTVFRELANIGSVLAPYGLEVGSKSGEGVTLEGPPQARTALLNDLEKLEREPADKQERQDKLILAILRSPGQKLATYAEQFKVSAPTVSHDLDDLEPWLAGRGLGLQRKPGAGISITGEEMAVRRAILALLHRMTDYAGASDGYPHPDIILDLADLAPELDPLLGWTTPQSRDALNRYMAVLVQRVMDGCVLASSEPAPEPYPVVADRLATVLHEAFNIPLNDCERAALAIELAGCRSNVPQGRRGVDDAHLAALAAEMITLFDPVQAPVLKMDEVLTDGLTTHLRSALVRIRHAIELADPMREQIAKTYPDIMERCRKACQALRPFGHWLPDDEVSLVAAHFGAALLRLSEQGFRQRAVRVGVICVHGIGSSYLLASQVKRAFGPRVVVEVGWHDDKKKWRQYDILVSTTDLPDAGMPVITVPPMLDSDDIGRIGEMLSRQHAAPATLDRAEGAFSENLRALAELAAGAGKVADSFAIVPADQVIDFTTLAGAAGLAFGVTPEDAAAITGGLIARENISTQVVPELGIILLHCRTEGVAAPVFGVMLPSGGGFSHPGLGGVKSAVVLLLPRSASRELSEMMGCLSAALIEQDAFLDAVRSGREEAIRAGLEGILGEFLFQFSLQKLKG